MRSYSRKEIFQSRVDEKVDEFVDQNDREPNDKELQEIHAEALNYADEFILQQADWARDRMKEEGK